jgi:hypothetical protein
MKMVDFLFVWLFIFPTAVLSSDIAQEKTLMELSVRLEKLNKELFLANQSQLKIDGSRETRIMNSGDFNKNMNFVFNPIIKEMKDLSNQYKNNPYVKITGFSVNVGMPPSVTISLEFKQ